VPDLIIFHNYCGKEILIFSLERVSLGNPCSIFTANEYTMRYFILLAFMGCFFACAPASPEETPVIAIDTEADQAAVQQLIQDIFDNIWSGTDTSYVSEYHTNDFVLLEHGEVWTNDTIRNYQLRKAANMQPDAPARKNSFSFFRMEQNGDEIWTAYHNYGHWVNAAQDTVSAYEWLESAVAVRTDEGWKLRMMHSTRVGR
jgi:sarcosine oxidase delta subunit